MKVVKCRHWRFIYNEVLCIALYCFWFAYFDCYWELSRYYGGTTQHTQKISLLTLQKACQSSSVSKWNKDYLRKLFSCLHGRQGWLLSLGCTRMLFSILVQWSINISPENVTQTYPLLLYSLHGLKSWHQYIRIFVLWLGFSTLQTGSSYRECAIDSVRLLFLQATTTHNPQKISTRENIKSCPVFTLRKAQIKILAKSP